MNTIELAGAKYEALKYLGEIESASVIQDPRTVIKNLLFFLSEYERELDGERRVSAGLQELFIKEQRKSAALASAELEEAEKRVLAKAAELGIYNHHATKALVEALKGK